MRIKEMVYDGSGNTEVLYQESSGGYGLAVVNTRGSHPCGYITFPGIEKLKSYDDIFLGNDEEDFDVHGGFTYLGGLSKIGLKGVWLGWDYAHLGDWCQGVPPYADVFNHSNDTKYTTEDVAAEARVALRLIQEGKYELIAD